MTAVTTATTGRAKTVLVFGQGQGATAVVSAIVAQVRNDRRRTRLLVTGPAAMETAALKHLRQIIVPVVGRITQCLRLPRLSYEVSVVNLGAASMLKTGLKISGFSADVAVFLALLSVALQLPLPQDVVATGHIASPDGDVRPVSSIPAKLDAALADPSTRKFVYPSLDASVQVLTPAEAQRAADAVVNAKQHLDVVAVSDVNQLLQTILTDEAVVLAGLRSGFFAAEGLCDGDGGPTEHAVRFLAQGNRRRFWSVLESHLLGGHTGQAQQLLSAWLQFHVGQNKYPQDFGRKLLQLVRSLPPAPRRLKTTFPLLSMDECLQLGQLTGEAHDEDLRHLIDAAFGRIASPTDAPPEVSATTARTPSEASAAVDTVVEQISADALAQKVGLPIDNARAVYVMEYVTIESHELFCQTIAAFYLALLRHTDAASCSADPRTVADEATALLDRAFADKGSAVGALAEARDGTRGGMRFVLDVMTEHYKTKRQTQYVNRVLADALDPLDWDGRVAFVAALLERLGPHLPADIRSAPPKRFARHHDQIVHAYVQSLDRVKQLLRTL